MMLWDALTVSSRLTGSGRPADMTVSAHVFTVSGSNPFEPNRPGLMIEVLRAILAPDLPRAIDWTSDDVVHKGTTYRVDGPPMGRYQHGRLHHWTINLKRSDG